MFKYNSSLFRDVYTSCLFLVFGHFVTDILSEQSLMELVRVKCMQPAEQLREAALFNIFLSFHAITIIPEGVVVGLRNNAWSPK